MVVVPVMVRFAVLAPAAAGPNVTLMVQVPATTSTNPGVQVVPELWKSAAFVPVTVTGVTASVTVTLPLFVTVAAIGLLVEPTLVLGKATGRGVISRLGLFTAVPVMARVAVALVVVAEKVTVADSAPTIDGVPLMFLVQVWPGVSTWPNTQAPEGAAPSEKSAALVPPKVVTGLDMVIVVVPVLVIRN